jgi:hypothetical protein
MFGCAVVNGIVINVGESLSKEKDLISNENEKKGKIRIRGGGPTTVIPVVETVPLVTFAAENFINQRDLFLYLSHLILNSIPNLPDLLSKDSNLPLTGTSLYLSLISICEILLSSSHLFCELKESLGFGSPGNNDGTTKELEDTALEDVAKAFATGKVNKIIESTKKKKSLNMGDKQVMKEVVEIEIEDKTLEIPKSILGRWMEPLFKPELLKNVNETFEKVGFELEGWTYSVEELDVGLI